MKIARILWTTMIPVGLAAGFADAQTPDVVVAVGGVVPVGPAALRDTQNPGLGGALGVELAALPRLTLGARIEYSQFTAQNDRLESGGIIVAGRSAETIWGLVFEGQFRFPARGFTPFVSVGSGYFLQTDAADSPGFSGGGGISWKRFAVDARAVHIISDRNGDGGRTTFLSLQMTMRL